MLLLDQLRFKVLAVFLVLALVMPMVMMPIGVAQAQEKKLDNPVVKELPLSVELIENTRERAVVRINDILITQELDTKYSTKESAKATLKFKDLNSGKIEEIKITTS